MLCSGCFQSHFPQPNMKSCKLKKYQEKQSFWPNRLRGGADNEDDAEDSIERLKNLEQSVTPMVAKAFSSSLVSHQTYLQNRVLC